MGLNLFGSYLFVLGAFVTPNLNPGYAPVKHRAIPVTEFIKHTGSPKLHPTASTARAYNSFPVVPTVLQVFD